MKASLSQLRTALDKPGATRLILLHGPDEASAREFARQLARAMGADAERVDLEGAQLKGDPGLLAGEAAALSLFGGARFIRVNAMGEESLEAVELLLAAPVAGNPVVAIAPGVKTSGKLVKAAIAHPLALSFACYPPEGMEADRVAAEIARELGLRIEPRLAGRLAAAAAGDRAVLTRELEKFALFLDASPEAPQTLSEAVIDQLGADLGEGELGDAIEATVAGAADRLGAELARLEQAGVSPIPLLRGLVRRLATLAELRAEVAAGARAEALAERVFFKERAATLTALRNWSPERLAAAIDHLRAAERRLLAGGPDVTAAAACLAVARQGARRR
ncbi:MAG: DNA polymerase III subunit delta [Proteobacteria bacterium SG_bin6]|nr:MAG: DNA polymerase III subunit delta [Proteobacteria bacterium SG_bin6]